MKKKSVFILGLLAALLTLSVVLTGCETEPQPVKWDEAFMHKGTDAYVNSRWKTTGGGDYPVISFVFDGSEYAIRFYTSTGSFSDHFLRSVSGKVYTVVRISDSSYWTFKAVMNGENLVISGVSPDGPSGMAGTYAKDQ
jgi:hypothetical protein